MKKSKVVGITPDGKEFDASPIFNVFGGIEKVLGIKKERKKVKNKNCCDGQRVFGGRKHSTDCEKPHKPIPEPEEATEEERQQTVGEWQMGHGRFDG